MKTTMKGIWFAAFTILLMSDARAGLDDVGYHYCFVGKPPNSEVVYFSAVFIVTRPGNGVAIQNAFYDFIGRQHDSSVSAGAQCMGPCKSREEAETRLKDHAADLQRGGKQVVQGLWRYRGG